jgi:hypothetical protein
MKSRNDEQGKCYWCSARLHVQLRMKETLTLASMKSHVSHLRGAHTAGAMLKKSDIPWQHFLLKAQCKEFVYQIMGQSGWPSSARPVPQLLYRL